MADRYDVGDVAELSTRFLVGEPGVSTDPGVASLRITPPTAAAFEVAPARTTDDDGPLYSYSLELTEAGVWGGDWSGTPPAQSGESFVIEVYGRLVRDGAYLEAYARLRALTEAELDPILSPEELEDLLRAARRPDAAGLGPGDEGWASTFHVNAAAAAGWRRKAGKIATRSTDIAADDGSVKRSQAYDHCLEMARLYGRQGLAVAHLSAAPHDSGADRAVVNLSEARLEELAPGAAAGGGPV